MSGADAGAAPPRRRCPTPKRATPALRVGALALLVTLAVAGCASSDYRESLDAWTRSEDAYRHAEVLAAAHATLETEPFRRAYVAEYARLFALTNEQREALLEAQVDEGRTGWSVIVALYTADPAWTDLSPRRGIWSVRLEGPRGWLPVQRVRRLDPKNPTWRELFPYFGPHYGLFELRFDRGLGEPTETLARPGEELALVIAGAPGQLRFAWSVP